MDAMKLTLWDTAEHLKTDEDCIGFLQACAAEDPALIPSALGVVARARGMTQLAKDAGLSRESLYRALSADGNPEFSTIVKVTKALGIDLSFQASS